MKPTIQVKKAISPSGFSSPRAFMAILLCTAAAGSMLTGTMLAVFRPEAPAKVSNRTLTFADRVAYQRAIEEVYWRHRIWPRSRGERPDPNPSLDEIIPPAQLENKVMDYLRNSQAVENYWQRPLTAEQLQAEIDRMAKHTRQPEVLRELFDALGNDPFVIAECLARPVLTGRLTADLSAQGKPRGFVSQRTRGLHILTVATTLENVAYALPKIVQGDPPCTDDTWTATSTTNAPTARFFDTAVWTGSEMVVWGGIQNPNNTPLNTGGRYNPITDSWTATSIINAPSARFDHTAVWTDSEIIVWGGTDDVNYFDTGGRYNPATNNWTATSTTNAPAGRCCQAAVWTGTVSEMIVWGEMIPRAF